MYCALFCSLLPNLFSRNAQFLPRLFQILGSRRHFHCGNCFSRFIKSGGYAGHVDELFMTVPYIVNWQLLLIVVWLIG